MSPHDPMNMFPGECQPALRTSVGYDSGTIAHGPAPHARHSSHDTFSHHHQVFPSADRHGKGDIRGGQTAQTAPSFQCSSTRGDGSDNRSPTVQQQNQLHPCHSTPLAQSPLHQQNQQHDSRSQLQPQQTVQQPQQQPPQPHASQQQQYSIPEHHHTQYPTFKDYSKPHTNGNSSGPGAIRSHTLSLNHPQLHLTPYQEQNQKQQYQQPQQQPQQQHYNGFPQGYKHTTSASPFRTSGSSHLSHSMSMPMKPPTPTRMHMQFGPGASLYDRRGSLPGLGNYGMDATMDSEGSSNGDSGDEVIVQGNTQWTRQEDILLREAVVKFNGKAWKRIAEYCFPDGSRDKDQCLQRWRMISKPRSIKGPWTPEEDRQLRTLVNELGAEKWVLIASRLGSRTGKQCRERWHNHLDPKIDKSPFTAKEDELIFKLFAQFGSKWAEMSKLMPGRPDNAIKNHFNTSMQRKRRRLSLQDPSELQMKEHGPSNSAVSPPLASPTSATSPSITRHNRFDPYERRHSMPSLEFSPKAHNHHHFHQHHQQHQHHRNGSRDYSGETASGHPYHQSSPPPYSGHHHPQQQQHHQQQQHSNSNGTGPSPYPRTIPTPPKTPDTKASLMFSASMSRSISLGSSERMGMPSGNTPGGHSHSHHQHSHSLSHNGPPRPNLPGISSLHSPPPPPPTSHNGNNHGHHLYNTSTLAATASPSSSTTTSLASPSSSTPPSAVVMARSSSAMGISNESPSAYYNMSPSQQQQSMRPGFPRLNIARHDSAGNSSSRFVRGHEHHRSLDIDPLSALAELAHLADQQRQMPGSVSPPSGNNKTVTTTSGSHHGATTVVVQSSEENDEDSTRHLHLPNHQRRGSQGGESMSRSGSGSSMERHNVEDNEDGAHRTIMERSHVHTPAPTQGPPPPGPLGRRFSTLGHVKEEEQGEEGEDHQHQQQQHPHSYHIDARKNTASPVQGALGHSKSYSGHSLGGGRDFSSSMTGYRSKRLSVDFSVLSDPTSDGDEDDDEMKVDEEQGGRYYPHQHQHFYFNQQSYQQQQRYPAKHHTSSSSPTSPRPNEAYLSMRRGSVRELMAIDHLCLSSEEVERC
ncbi:Transcription factor myb3r-5 [Linnemannia zychae]|nr:Transcription factor myb3r-5 [Linnemannia zychae]